MALIVYNTLPVPAVREHTVEVPAGVVTFGVEYRHLDESMILAYFGPDAEAKFNGGVRPAGMADVVLEDGLALHVFDTATGEERLRFDCFDDAPHFHLLDPGPPRNIVIEHDPAAGPLLDQAQVWLRCDLAGMLREAGAEDLAARIDPEVVGARWRSSDRWPELRPGRRAPGADSSARP